MSWRVVVTYDWASLSHRLIMMRQAVGGCDLVTGFDERGMPIVTFVEEGVMAEFNGFVLPDDVATLIAEAVKPGPSQESFTLLEEALVAERRRVDRLLERATITPAD